MSNTNSNGGTPGQVTRRGGRGPKVERVAAEYGLDGLGDELVRRWTGEGYEQQSLRELAELVNRRLVRKAQSRAGAHVLDGEAENVYRLLTDDDVTAGMRTDARRSLAESGVDVDQLEAAFISYQSVHNYLTQHRDVSRDAEQTAVDTTDADLVSMRKLRARLQTVTTDTVDKWKRNDLVELDEYDVDVAVRITCPSCDTRLTLSALADQGGCNCPEKEGIANE